MSDIETSSSVKKQALLADDDAGVQLTLTSLLQQKGFTVTAVSNGMDAVEALSTVEFDIVLLDIRMPDMDGFDACRCMRQLEFGMNVPVLMLTGQDDTESIKRAFDVGATDFVAKPINFVLMGFRIDYIVRAANNAAALRKAEQRSHKAQRIAQLGHIEWNLDKKMVHCSNGMRDLLLLPDEAVFNSFKLFMKSVHPEDQDRVQVSISESLASGVGLNLEHRMIRADGSVRFVLQSSEFRVDPKKLTQMMVTIQDISDRIDSEKKIDISAQDSSV